MAFNLLKIKGLISQNKLTQSDFADKIGVTRQTVINYFNERSKIDAETIGRIAELFNVSVNYFFTEDNLSQVNEPQAEYTPKKKYIEERINELEQRVSKLEQKK